MSTASQAPEPPFVRQRKIMKLKIEYTIIFLSRLPEDFKTPIRVPFEEQTFEVTDLDMENMKATASVEGRIDSSNLVLRKYPDTPAGPGHPPGIEVQEDTKFSAFLSNQLHVLSFLIDVPIRHAVKSHMLIPECEEDNKLLNKLGTSEVYIGAVVVPSTRTFWLREVTLDFLSSLMDKQTGVALYSQALLCQEHVSAFREYWKVLESAFGAKDDELIDLLKDYGPAKELEFTEDELRELHILRGRASHAESRSGIVEYNYISRQASRKLRRLKCLAEQTILTKKTWGTRTKEIKRLLPLWGYVTCKGSIVLIQQPTKQQNGNTA